MPVLARLLERGVMADIAILEPVLSPLLWTSIATGKHADRHGIPGFTQLHRETLRVQPVASISRRTGDLEYPEPARLSDKSYRLIRAVQFNPTRSHDGDQAWCVRTERYSRIAADTAGSSDAAISFSVGNNVSIAFGFSVAVMTANLVLPIFMN